MQVCHAEKVSLDSKVRVGTTLEADDKYLSQACDCLSELGVKLSQVLWRKLDSSSCERADGHLLRRTFDMIEGEQYNPAIKIFSFALKPPMKISDASDRCRCVVNLAQSYKWRGDQKKANRILDAEDWSASSFAFRLAVAVLKDEFEEAATLMRKIGSDGEISKEDYEAWPLFREFRKSKLFIEAYRELFSSASEVRGVPKDVGDMVFKVTKEAPVSGGSGKISAGPGGNHREPGRGRSAKTMKRKKKT